MPLFLLFIGAILWFSYNQQQKHKDALQELASNVKGLQFYGDEVRGTTKGVGVHVDTYSTGSGKNKSTWTRFRVTDPTSLEAESIAAEGLFSGMGKLVSGQDVQLGDPGVDAKLLLRGSEFQIVARMDADARRIVRDAVTRGWEHDHGTWRYRRRGKMSNAAEMSAILAHGFEAVRCLRLGSRDWQGALVERALTDPLPSARVRALEVRLKSGLPLSSEDEERLIATGDVVGVMVAERMGVRGIPILKQALQAGSGELRLRAALGLAKHGEGDVAARSVLAAALKVEAYQDLVIEALEKVGTVDEVPLLTPIADAWMHSHRHAAKSAVRAIQSRIRGAGVGQLSLAASTGGGLAVADAQEGGLTEPESESEAKARAARASSRQTEG